YRFLLVKSIIHKANTFLFSSRRRHTRFSHDWSSDVCSSDLRGQGNAAAVVTAELKEEGDSTLCILTTDLTISGKAAQFGRGVLRSEERRVGKERRSNPQSKRKTVPTETTRR